MRYILTLLLLLIFTATSQSETIKVGIKSSEPWVMYDKNATIEDRKPIGFSVDLWNKIAKDMGVET
ncbi:MAG: transporter substrate-binding domain-containing protein, partial [Sulfurovaceae bacterium]|nr:transporter substrate-binding domain-containing protein [Sulfurovaceae bacterium]